MKMISLQCPKCGANLETEDGLDIFYCKYCGHKIILSDMTKAAYKAKIRAREIDLAEKNRDKEIWLAERFKDKDIQQERYRIDCESREKRRAMWPKLLEGLLPFLLFLAIGVSCFFLYKSDIKEKKEHEEYTVKLQQVEAEIGTAIKENNFDTALFKANQLHCEDNCSQEESITWDAKRTAYIDLVEEKIHEAEINNPDYLVMPASSESFSGKKYTDVVDQLSATGFTNISSQPAVEKAGFIRNRESSVEHIIVGGKTEFEPDSYFRKDTPIIIYYYAK